MNDERDILSERLILRVSPVESEAWRFFAARDGVSLSEWIRRTLDAEAERRVARTLADR